MLNRGVLLTGRNYGHLKLSSSAISNILRPLPPLIAVIEWLFHFLRENSVMRPVLIWYEARAVYFSVRDTYAIATPNPDKIWGSGRENKASIKEENAKLIKDTSSASSHNFRFQEERQEERGREGRGERINLHFQAFSRLTICILPCKLLFIWWSAVLHENYVRRDELLITRNNISIKRFYVERNGYSLTLFKLFYCRQNKELCLRLVFRKVSISSWEAVILGEK